MRGKGNGMLPSHRVLFDIPREICYLNAASWSPLPVATQEAGRVGVARKGRPWLIDPALPAKQYERARRAAARVIKAYADDVALISSVSYGVASAAKMLTVPAGSRVLVLENDHSSAVLEWMTRAPLGRVTRAVGRPPVRRRCWNGCPALRSGGSPWTWCRNPATAIGPRRSSHRSSSPAGRPSRSPRSHPCTGRTAE